MIYGAAVVVVVVVADAAVVARCGSDSDDVDIDIGVPSDASRFSSTIFVSFCIVYGSAVAADGFNTISKCQTRRAAQQSDHIG